MAGTVVFSLDCEGKWGSADKLAAPHVRVLTEPELRKAYADVIQTFEHYRVPATFAFVAGFTMSKSEQIQLKPALETLAPQAPTLLSTKSPYMAVRMCLGTC
jgi:hypothetical protein